MKFCIFLIFAILAVSVFCESEEKKKMEGNTGESHQRFLRQLLAPYGVNVNSQYGGSGPSAGSGWNGGIVGSARGMGFGTGSDGYH
ncbi:hypothetical protein L5515_002437 [Caenorhabditis briggsae]|uniref:Uncharacterized protein n=1 Tax=Caenorhabditis briggsae TaxID=6238 RepID=A0AAE9E425_CAEBR|nr:hypothetical protein L5515_002437 [Caenorhabditis briggsae]